MSNIYVHFYEKCRIKSYLFLIPEIPVDNFGPFMIKKECFGFPDHEVQKMITAFFGYRLESRGEGMDDLDHKIMRELQEDGRRSYKEIARRLKVSDGTVRLRTEKMIRERLIRIKALIDPFRFENQIYAVIGVNIEKSGHANKMKQISELKGVVSVLNPTGRYDLFVEVFLESKKELKDLLVNMFTKVGVQSTETFIYLDGINKWIISN
jgi:DNA-binding Lrp family transcriptional regulator